MTSIVDTTALRELLEKATKGPWEVERRDAEDGSINYEVWNRSPNCFDRITTLYEAYDSKRTRQDAHLIAAAVTALPALLDEVERRRADEVEMVKALERCSHGTDDASANARALLAKVKESDALRIAQSDNRDRSST